MFRKLFCQFLIFQYVFVCTLSAFGPESANEDNENHQSHVIYIPRVNKISSEEQSRGLIVPESLEIEDEIEGLAINTENKSFALIRKDQEPLELEKYWQPTFPWELEQEELFEFATAHTFFLRQFLDGSYKFEMLLPGFGGIGGWDGSSSHSGGGGGGGRVVTSSGRSVSTSGGSVRTGGGSGRSSSTRYPGDGVHCDRNGRNCRLTITITPGPARSTGQISSPARSGNNERSHSAGGTRPANNHSVARPKPAPAAKPKPASYSGGSGRFYTGYDKALHVQRLINTKPCKDVYEYSDQNGIPREVVAFLNENRRSDITFAAYMKETNPFYGEYDKALDVQRLINTKPWKDVYEYSDQNGIPREVVAFLNENRRSDITFTAYMKETNPFYGEYDKALHVQRLINTKPWKDVYEYSDQNGIPREVVAFLNQNRLSDITFTAYMKGTNPFYETYDKALLHKTLHYDAWTSIRTPLKDLKDKIKLAYDELKMPRSESKIPSLAHALGAALLDVYDPVTTWAAKHAQENPNEVKAVLATLMVVQHIPFIVTGSAEMLINGGGQPIRTLEIYRNFSAFSDEMSNNLNEIIQSLDLTREEKALYATAAVPLALLTKMGTKKLLDPIARSNLVSSIRGINIKFVEIKDFHSLKGSTINGQSKFWTRVENVTARGQTNKAYKRDDLIDLNKVDPERGLTNRQLMSDGLAPIGPDNKPINLHHMIQTHDGAIAEVTKTFHQEYSRIIHINPNTMPSGINRSAFDQWKKEYWKMRLNELEGI